MNKEPIAMATSSIRPTRVLLGVALALYLYALLGATATLFYELYHLTGFGAIYYGYSAFKAAAYYFGSWEYQWLACLLVGALVALPWWRFLRSAIGGRG
ncbi:MULTISPECIES: hypothetical protein [Spongiibacter]|uniref:hypothetical protein n=1 Tax=Spongiibacter TaxID=630749 RepID=UPI000C49938A|nr:MULTISPECIES: hypothetical protein [Spongiibacter]MBI58066.1 hypothetical protein [Spongiibacter sp.]|tara:strand:+ start:630 stop:926 length:297 start_codon:yes stop_codon:yes gene_type:complete